MILSSASIPYPDRRKTFLERDISDGPGLSAVSWALGDRRRSSYGNGCRWKKQHGWRPGQAWELGTI